MTRWLVPAMFVILLGLGLVAAVTGANDLLPWVLMASILPVSAWYLEDGRRAAGPWFPAVALIAAIAATLAIPVVISVTESTTAGTTTRLTGQGFHNGRQQVSGLLNKFSSYEELENFVGVIDVGYIGGYYEAERVDVALAVSAPAPASVTSSVTEGSSSDFSFWYDSGGDQANNQTSDFSTTNIQVAGVDEADIVKSDGEYIYVVTGNKVIIIDACPAEEARILSEIEETTEPVEIFINGDKLVILGQTFAKVYDISDRENPSLSRDVSFDGYYFNSRMIGDFVYLIINSSTIYSPIYSWAGEIALPRISINGNDIEVQATEIYYFEDIHGNSYKFVTIMAINTQNDDEETTGETFLLSTAQNIFVSSTNIYIIYTNYQYFWSNSYWYETTENTIIHKIAIADGQIEYKSYGEVPGRVLNQFSMDEYDGYFRVATTTGYVWSSGSSAAKNHVYILDENLNIVGRLENLARTEEIYAARFMGNRAYLVTFRQTDPLFVLDLSDPEDPKVLGELEIPGYSDYLHPYDETHIIGVGRDDGVKIALFDVSDPENPVEISKYEVGSSWWTNSYALDDHRAFLFSRARNLLVMPIGDYYQQDAYVFNISPEDGITLKGTITHQENNDSTWDDYYSWYGYNSNRSVKRSLYIDNVLYTISSGLVKMNALEDLSEINEVELQ